MPPAARPDVGAGIDEPSNDDSKVLTDADKNKPQVQQDKQEEGQQRPYPWNYFSDSTYVAMGVVILFFVCIPTMTVIVLSNLIGYALQRALYDCNPIGKYVLDQLRSIQRVFFQWVANYILLDPRDAPYLPWMVWGTFIQPAAFYWAYQRYNLNGWELSTFLIYHLLRVGPRHQMFAHHAVLVHKEGHAYRKGLFRNLLNMEKRVPYPKTMRRCLLDHFNAGIAGLLYGTIPNHYATAHNKIHHRWHNDTGDVHTNMDFDRSEFKGYIMYLPRFAAYWTGISPVLLFWKLGEYRFLMDLAYGMMYYYSIGFLVWNKMGFIFYWSFFLYPLLEGASFLGLIAYLWHMFSDESDPTNQYINSITILRGSKNVWNEDYHVVHHHEPGVHWSDVPKSFEENIDKYVESRATVFGDCQQNVLVRCVFGKKWDDLADYFIDLQYVFANGDLNKDKLMTVKQIKEYESDQERTTKLHADVKAMLLRRLKYHYLGTRKDEWAQFNAKLNENARDFDNVRIKQS